MIRIRKGLAFAIGVAICSAASAQVVTQDCTGCSIGQVEALASNCSNGYSYITDFDAQKLYKVCFRWDVNDEFRPPKREKDYIWATPETFAQQLFDAYEGVYLNNGHVKAEAAHVRVYIPAKVPLGGDNGWMNAYDVMEASANQNALSDYLLSGNFSSAFVNTPNTTLAAKVADLLNAIHLGGIIVIGNFPLSFTIDFNDGSHVAVKYNVTTQRYEEIQGSYIDAHGNTIPQSLSMANNNGTGQTYYFSGGNTYDYGNIETVLRNLQAQGIPVTNGHGSIVTCVQVGTTGTTRCSVQTF